MDVYRQGHGEAMLLRHSGARLLARLLGTVKRERPSA